MPIQYQIQKPRLEAEYIVLTCEDASESNLARDSRGVIVRATAGEVIEYQNTQDNKTKLIGIVHHALAATTADGSMRHLHFDHATWHSLLEEQEK